MLAAGVSFVSLTCIPIRLGDSDTSVLVEGNVTSIWELRVSVVKYLMKELWEEKEIEYKGNYIDRLEE